MTMRQALQSGNNFQAIKIVKRIPSGCSIAEAEHDGLITSSEAGQLARAIKNLPRRYRQSIRLNKYEVCL